MYLPLRPLVFLLLLILWTTFAVTNVNGKVLFCYYIFKARSRPGKAQMSLTDVRNLPCSHFIFAYGDWDEGSLEFNADRFTDGEVQFLKALSQSKQTKAFMGFSDFAALAKKSSSQISTFAQRTASFLRDNYFDGLDLIALFGKSIGNAEFTKICKALRNAFNSEHTKSGKPKLFLSAIFKDVGWEGHDSYDVGPIQSQLDFVVVKAMPKDWESKDKIVHPSRLFGPKGEYSENRTLSHWADKGIPKEKLVLVIPTFGWSYILKDENTRGVDQPAIGHAAAGPLTNDPGFLAYYEVCSFIKSGTFKADPIGKSVAPIAWGKRDGQLECVGYESPTSVKEKVQFIIKKGFQGLAFVSIDFDDFRGTCGQGKLPLTKAGWDALIGEPLEDIAIAEDQEGERGGSGVIKQDKLMTVLTILVVALVVKRA